MRHCCTYVWVLIILCTILSACSPSNPIQGSFFLGVSSAALSVYAGEENSLAVTLIRNNFSDSVSLSVEQKDGLTLPDGIIASFSPANASSNTSSLTIRTAESLRVGTYSLRIKGISSKQERFQEFSLSVNAKPQLELAVTNPPTAIIRGQTGTATVNLTRTNLPDDIALTLELSDGSALPDGFITRFDANPTHANSSNLTIGIGASVLARTYNLRVRGTAGSFSKTSAAFSLAVQEVPSFALSFATSPTSAVVGNSAVGAIQIARTNFAGAIALSLEKSDGTVLPAGITATFTPNNTATNSSTLTVNVGSSVTPGNFNLRVKGISGSLTQTLAFTLEVKAAPAFSLALTAAPASVIQGQNVPVNLNITRTNFTSALTLSLEKSDGTAAPAGISATFAPTNTTGNTSAITLATTTAVAPATYNLRIKATNDTATNYVNFALEVQAIPNFKVSLGFSPTPLVQGTSTSIALNISRTNFNSAIALSLEKSDGTPAPAGITAIFNPNDTTDDTSGLTLSTTTSVSPATYSLRIKATSGSLSDYVNFALEVRAIPNFELGLVAAPTPVIQGDNTSISVNIARTNFIGEVILSLEKSDGTAAPTGISATFNNTSTNSSTVTLSTTAAVPPGTYSLRIKGVSTVPGLTKTASFSLEVQAIPWFDLGLVTSLASVIQGETTSLNLHVFRINFKDPISFSLEGADGSTPPGISINFSPNNTPANDSTLTLTAPLEVPPGRYSLRIKGTSGSQSRLSPQFTLEVQPIPSFGLDVANPTATVVQGNSISTTLGITRSNLSGAIALSLEKSDGTPVPAGISANFTPDATGNSQTLTIATSASLPPNNYNLRIRGVSDKLSKTIFFTLVVAPTCKGYLQSSSNNILVGYTPNRVYSPGEQLELKVSSPKGNFNLVIFREGIQPQLKQVQLGLSAYVQAMPSLPYATNAAWSTSYTLTIPQDWTPGLYNALLVETNSTQRCYEVVFTVNTPSTQPRIAVVVPEYTWQAYNSWGNASFYGCATPCTGGTTAPIVTTQRPNPWVYIRGNSVYNHMGNSMLRLLNWLDKKGYSYNLLSDSQLDSNPQALNGFSMVMLASHNEYWTGNMYDHLEQYLARGGNLINWGGNNVYWKIVKKDDLIEVRKDASHHTLNTEAGGLWRQLGRPEAALLGSRYTSPGSGQDKNFAYAVRNANHWALAGTGLGNGQSFGDMCSGWETDKVDPLFSPKNIDIIAQGTNPPDPRYSLTEQTGADMTYYNHPGGGGVFSAASIAFLRCTDDPVVSQIMSNVVNRFLSR